MASQHFSEDAVAAADKEMEERANRAKELLSRRYHGLRNQQVCCWLACKSIPPSRFDESTLHTQQHLTCTSLLLFLVVSTTHTHTHTQKEKHERKTQFEREMNMVGVPESEKEKLRRQLEKEEIIIQKELRKKITVADFESLAVIGRGAFGEVRLARRKGKPDDPATGKIFALKSMKKEMMVMKNQVHHVRAERDALAAAETTNRWLTVLHYSFFDESHLYMAMEFMPGGDLMSLLIKEDTFSEEVTQFFMAEAAQAISSVHALGYIHRDIKPDNVSAAAEVAQSLDMCACLAQNITHLVHTYFFLLLFSL